VKILIFSDIHGDLRALRKVVQQPVDVYIAAGDLATFGRGLERCAEVLKPLGDKLWILPGNHETHHSTHALCDRFGFYDFHGQIRSLPSQSGLAHFAGLGYSNITPFGTPGEYSEDEIRNALSAFSGITPLYLVAHVPPRRTKLDEYAPGQHAGSPSLRDWVEREQPKYLFCGHIHEAAGLSEDIGQTKCVNVGKNGYLLDI
jgi:Icc-related predicted phosphoesterase